MFPNCPAPSAIYLSAQAEFGRQWNTQNPSEPYPTQVSEQMKHPVYSLFRHSESQYAAGLIYLLVLLCVAGELQVVAEDLGAGSGGLSVAPLLVALHLIQELGLLQEYLRLAR